MINVFCFSSRFQTNFVVCGKKTDRQKEREREHVEYSEFE